MRFPLPSLLVISCRNGVLATALLLICLATQASAQPAHPVQKNTRLHLKNSGAATLGSKRLSLNNLPGHSMNYAPDNAGGWIHISNSTYTYDTQGRLTEEIRTEPDTNENLFRFTNAYDAQNNQTEDFFYLWENGTWALDDLSLKIDYTYNSNNQVTSQEFKYYDRVSGTFENEFKPTYVYDAAGRLTENELQEWDGTSWQVYARILYAYSPGATNYTEEIYQLYDNGAYQNVTRWAEVIWHDPANWLPESYNTYTWDGSTWVLDGRERFTYYPFGTVSQLVESYLNSTWVPSRLDSVTYDAQLNYTGSYGKEWNGTAWEFYWQDQEVLTYNTNLEVTERLIRIAVSDPAVLEDVYRIVYTSFLSATASQTPSPVTVYPNPVQNELTIAGNLTGPATAHITDLTGRIVQTVILSQTSSRVKTAHLPAGTYVLHIQHTRGSSSTRFVKL